MKRLRVLSHRIAGLFGRDRRDAELREELECLAALQVDEQVASGMAPEEARRRVVARTGSVTAVQEAVRDQRALAWLDGLVRDVRVGLRMLRRNPLFAGTAVVSLALGIGANAAIFSIVDHLLLRALPVAHADRLLLLDAGSWTYPIFEQVKARGDRFDGAAAFANEALLTRHGDRTRHEQGLFVSGDFFDLLGVTATIGRTLTAADDVRGGGPDGPVAVISHAYWARQFGLDADVLGRTVTIERVPFTIVGVTPKAFFGPEVGRAFDIAIPFGTEPLLRGAASSLDERQNWWVEILVRRRAGQTEAQVADALRLMQPAIREATRTRDPDYLSEPLSVVSAERGRSTLRTRYRDALRVLMAAAVAVLLVTSANVANLLFARASARRAEMSIRLAVGASRRRLIRQLLLEGWLLAVLGAAAGLAFALWTARFIVDQLSTTRAPVMLDVGVDWRMLAFTAGAACVITPLFAMLPALRATRLAPGDVMKEQTRTVAGEGPHALGQTLVAAQIALSLALVVLACLLVGTFTRLAWQSMGLESRRVVVAETTVEESVPVEERLALFGRLRDVVGRVPGVDKASLAVVTPLSGRGWNSAVLEVDGAPVAGTQRERMVWANAVSDGYFATYGTAFLAGRDVAPSDVRDAPRVAVVNAAFVRRFIGTGPAVGRQLREGTGRPGETAEPRLIVGVVADAVYRDLRQDVPPTMYVPIDQAGTGARSAISIAARVSASDASPLQEPVSRAITQADSRATTQVMLHEVLVHGALRQERLVATVAGLFGGLALLLAVVGLYGVTAYTVSRRRGEIGVRLALGATPQRVLRLVLGRVAVLVSAGIVAGVGLSLWAGSAVRVLLHGLEPDDPVTIGSAVLVLLLTAGIAGAIPAWRAARTHPAVALRD